MSKSDIINIYHQYIIKKELKTQEERRMVVNKETVEAITPKPCLMYVRVSTEEQKEGFSIPAQIDLLIDYARKNNLRIVRIFEESQSAKDSGRTEFGKMLKYLKAHPDVNTILVEKTDRLYRNFKDYATLDDNKFEIHLVKENEILSRESTSHQKLVHGLKVLLAKNFIDNLREETYKGRKKKAEDGYIVGACPYGYYKTDRMTALVNEEQKKFVKRAFELYSLGYSLSKTVKKLSEEGFVYQKVAREITRGKLHAMLTSVVYTGRVEFEGNIFEGKFEAIIDQDLFDRVQVLLKRERESANQYMFSGVIRCQRCGSAITAELKKDKYLYYHCAQSGKTCQQKRIYLNEQYVYNAFARALKKIRVSPEDERWLKQTIHRDLRDVKFVDHTEKARLMDEVEVVKSQMSTLYNDKLEGTISNEFWVSKNAELEAKLQLTLKKAQAVSVTSTGNVEECMKYIYTIKELPEMFAKGGFNVRKRIAKLVFKRVTLKGRILKFTYAKPFSYFVEKD